MTASVRNLVLCIDGTSNKFGRRNTNVVKLYSQIKLDKEAGSDEPEQHAYYSSGIGTHAKNLPWLRRIERLISDRLDMALAWNVDENVKDAYGWLVRNYQQGDRIYLFGFSRGAYQVRVLASLVHEVGLLKTHTEKQVETAFGHFRSIHPHKPETREIAKEFKKTYCWWGVRIHFVGVWDTVSSIGLIKGDVFVSTSASVTNASHFRHALALDEQRVKFMPEYFREVNAHSNNRLQRRMECDIQEVWFAGCHADVGGVTRLGEPHHAGNVSLLWMRGEASQHGLMLKPPNLTCIPDDVRCGRSNSLKFGWWLFEVMFPSRHQVSFSGTGKNKLKWHWFRPRRIISGQHIHTSVWCRGAYRPRATLGNGIEIPIMLEGSSDQSRHDQPLETKLSYGTMPTCPEMVLTWIQRYAAHEIGVLLQSSLKNCSDSDKAELFGRIEDRDQPDFDRFVAIAAYIFAFGLRTEVEEFIGDAEEYLRHVLSAYKHPDLVRVLSLMSLMTKNLPFQRRVITSPVISSLIRLLGCSMENPSDNISLFVVDCICHLLQAEEAQLRNEMAVHVSEKISGVSILLGMLGANDPNQVLAALRIIVLLPGSAGHANGDLMRQRVKSKVQKLAKQGKGSVGLMAVSAFEVLREQNDPVHDLKFSNILAYLGRSLMLDIEGNTDFSLGNCNDAPPLALNNPQNSNRIIRKINSAIGSYYTSKRTAATLTFLKLCRYKDVRPRLLEKKVVDNFVKQLRWKRTSLLAAYALMTLLICVKRGIWESESFDVTQTLDRIAPSIVEMLKRGWFDDAVGLVEGFEIFRQLMKHEMLKESVEEWIYEVLKKKLQICEHDGIRTSLLCIDILEGRETHSTRPAELDGSTHSTTPAGTGSARHTEPDGPNSATPEGQVGLLVEPDGSNSITPEESRGMGSTRLVELDGSNFTIPENEGTGSTTRVVPRDSESTSLAMRLVNYSLGCLKSEPWASQRKCVKVLSALSQTAAGEVAICSRINEILGLLLPECYWEETRRPLMRSENLGSTAPDPILPSRMFGPAYALYSLSRNESLRQKIRESKRYTTLKGRYLSGSLVNGPDTPPWQVRTPDKSQVLIMVAMMIKAVDEGFLYDGIGSIPEALPVKVWHVSRLRALFAAVRALTAFRRGIRRPPLLDLGTPEHVVNTSPQDEDSRIPSVSNAPGQSNPGSQLPSSNINEQEQDTNRTQQTPPTTPCVPQTSSAIGGELYDVQSPPLESSDDQIREVQRAAPVVVRRSDLFQVPCQDNILQPRPLIEAEGGQPTVGLGTEHLESQSATAGQGMLSATSQRTPTGLITFEEFIACDLPTKKRLGLIAPRVRLRVRVGDQIILSPAVKVGNQPAGQSKSRTRWQGDFLQPVPPIDVQFEVTIERKFLVGYTCIRHIVRTSTRRIKDGHSPPYSAFPLRSGPPNRSARPAAVYRLKRYITTDHYCPDIHS